MSTCDWIIGWFRWWSELIRPLIIRILISQSHHCVFDLPIFTCLLGYTLITYYIILYFIYYIYYILYTLVIHWLWLCNFFPGKLFYERNSTLVVSFCDAWLLEHARASEVLHCVLVICSLTYSDYSCCQILLFAWDGGKSTL